jgi:hypothetical protein
VFGVWTRGTASHPRFYHDPQPQKQPTFGKVTRYLVKEQCYVRLLTCVADGDLRVCVPMSDVVNGQFDEGLKLLLGTGSEASQTDLTVEMKLMTISARRHCVHNVRPDRS